jgi:DnaT-like ssDNA binding protein
MTDANESVVLIASQPYDVYAPLDYANLYLQANFLASGWFDLTDDQRGSALVTATRLIDRQCWLGSPTGLSGQTLQWPRTGTGVDGVDDTIVPQGIIDGSVELAFAIIDGNDAVSNQVPGVQKIRDLAAGAVHISYFRLAEGAAAQTNRFPLPVQELVGKYLCGAGSGIDSLVTSGTDGLSVTEDDLGFDEGI